MSKKIDPRRVRLKLKLNQSAFWQKLGVGQSAGSRYETGRSLSVPILMLFDLVYGNATNEQLKSGKLAAQCGRKAT